MRFDPDAECLDLCFTVPLTRGKADIGRLTCNVALDVVKRTDAVESLSRDLGFVRSPDIMEVASPMRPAGRLSKARCSIRSRLIELAVALVTISLKDAARVPEVMVDMLFFPVRGQSSRPHPVEQRPPTDVDRGHTSRSCLS